MTARRITGWTLLSLVPATLATLAALAGQLAEAAAGFAIAGFLFLAIWAGIEPVTSPEGGGERTTETDPEDTR